MQQAEATDRWCTGGEESTRAASRGTPVGSADHPECVCAHAGVRQRAEEVAIRAVEVESERLAMPLRLCKEWTALVKVSADESFNGVSQEDGRQPVCTAV